MKEREAILAEQNLDYKALSFSKHNVIIVLH